MRRSEAGHTLVEMTISASVLLVVLGASLSVMDVFNRSATHAAAMVRDVDAARGVMTRITRDLRDAAGAAGTPGLLLRAQPQDLVMGRFEPAAGVVRTVRWCLDRASGRLYRHATDSPLALAGRCGAAGAAIVAQDVVNGERPLFAYDATTLADITSVDVAVFLDRNPLRPPREARLQSGVFLRNQNRRPAARFDVIALPGRNVQLNAQSSRDPEGGTLTYAWQDGGVPLPHTGAVASYVAPDAGPRTITLTVSDADGLAASHTQTVEVQP